MYLHSLLSSVPPEERAEFVSHLTVRSFRRGEVVLSHDETQECICCVADGLLRVVIGGPGNSADEEVTTDFIKRDEIFLASAFPDIRQQTRATLIAALPSSVQFVPWREFRKLCARHPVVLLALLKIKLMRTATLRRQLRRVSCSVAESLISRTMHELTQLAPMGTSGYDKRITQAVIASYTGLSREQVNKTMRDFEARGLLTKDAQGVHISANFAISDYQDMEVIPEKESGPDDELSVTDPAFFSDLLDDVEGPKK